MDRKDFHQQPCPDYQQGCDFSGDACKKKRNSELLSQDDAAATEQVCPNKQENSRKLTSESFNKQVISTSQNSALSICEGFRKRKLQETAAPLSRRRFAIPVGPRFQAAIPGFSNVKNEKSEESKWLGTQIWCPKVQTYGTLVGQGRVDRCNCRVPQSSDCVRVHMKEETERLKFEIGRSFVMFRCNDMGEALAQSWTSRRKSKFNRLVSQATEGNGQHYWNLATKLWTKDHQKLAGYYFNVFLPRYMSIKTRQAVDEVYSDDEDNRISKQGCE